jgi:hypothetical protein
MQNLRMAEVADETDVQVVLRVTEVCGLSLVGARSIAPDHACAAV